MVTRTNGVPMARSMAFIWLIRDASMPPYCARHLYSDALLRPCSRHSSATGTPPSACRRIAMIHASVYLLVFIRNLLRHHAEKIPLMLPPTFFGGGITCHAVNTRRMPGAASRPGSRYKMGSSRASMGASEARFLTDAAAKSQPGKRITINADPTRPSGISHLPSLQPRSDCKRAPHRPRTQTRDFPNPKGKRGGRSRPLGLCPSLPQRPPFQNGSAG